MDYQKIFEPYRVIITDAYGVFNFGKGISFNVLDEFTRWLKAGKRIFVLSNTTSTSAGTIESYAKKGMLKGVHYTDVMTSGQFAFEAVQAGELPVKGNHFYVLGTANFKKPEKKIPAIFENSPYRLVENANEADFIYCGIPQINGEDRTCSDDFKPLVQQLLKLGKPLVCANPDLIANEGGKFVVRQGTIAAMWKGMGGNVISYGKPDPTIFEALLQRFCPDVSKNEVLMIGDTIRTDILGASQAGIDSCLTLEGGVSEYEMEQMKIDLSSYLQKQEILLIFK